MKVLIVDDNEADRVLFQHTIFGFDNAIEVAQSDCGEDALERIRSEAFDCIFLDYRLPDMDGIEVLQHIYDKKTELTPCPVIMLTGLGNQNLIVEALKYGAQDYLVKASVSPEVLGIAIIKAQNFFDLRLSRNQAQEQFLHSQKMDAIGQLTGGIAHDFNNLLTIMFGNTRLLDLMLKKEPVDLEGVQKKIASIKGAAQRGADLVKQLMVFSRQRTLDPVSVNLNALIEQGQDLVSHSVGAAIDTKLVLDADIWPIDIDPSQFEHALINIVVNARDAMPDGGVITFETANIEIYEGTAHVPEGVSPGEYVRLCISDTGYGMDDETLEKVFEPFFTTKDVGKGTGLGLSMVYGFFRDSGGGVYVTSEKGKGTSFLIYVPRSQGSAGLKGAAVSDEEVLGGSESVLLVEDEPEIRALSAGLLRSYGYQVIEAHHAQEALEVLSGDTPIDLLFTDISMPGEMNGIQMAARAMAIRPALQVLFTTGYSQDSVPDYDLIRDRYSMLSKPYEYVDLLKMIRGLLD